MILYGKIDEVNKKLLAGLWLDDNRHDPIGFLNANKPSDSGKVVQKWYKDNMSNSDIQWTSVSNFDDFKGYVERNGVPDFVSLDHDLKKDKTNIKNINGLEYLYNGADCALWLVSYCLRKGLPIPRNYIHSANDNKRVFISKAFRLGNMGKDPMEGVDIDNQQEFIAVADRFRRNITNPNISKNVMKVKDNAQLGSADRLARMRGVKNTNDLFGKESFRESKENIKKIHINESQLHLLTEDVFINKLGKKKANLSYSKRTSVNQIRNMGNLKSSELLGTGLMDQDNNDTYLVPLKGGLMSYNITSIRGVDIMHYFKNKYDKKKTETTISVDGKKSTYELMMEDAEFQEFQATFLRKVSNVVQHAIKYYEGKYGKKQFELVSVLPVKSSSHFNEVMAKSIASSSTICELPIQVISQNMFEKDLTNLERDNDFISKNKDYYQGDYSTSTPDFSHIDKIDDTIRKYQNTTTAQNDKLIDEYNTLVDKIITCFNNYKSKAKKIGGNLEATALAKNYKKLADVEKRIRDILKRSHWDKAFSQIKYAKGPSVEKRSNEIQNLVSKVLGKTFVRQHKIDIVNIKKENFQIKNLTNDVRLGMRNYFKYNENEVDNIEQIKKSIFVIFDDNISGGATLSDLCYQASKIGIKFIVPITFGKMSIKYSEGSLQVTKPEGDFNWQ